MAGARTVLNAVALGSGRGVNCAERVDMHRDAITEENLAAVSSFSLLQCWKHNLRAT